MWVIPYLAAIVGVIVLDQISKILVCAYLYGQQVAIIPGILRFSYVENTGMAFGMLSDHRWIFMVLSVIGISAVAVYLYLYQKTTLGRIALSLIIAGGIGNMIDRTMLGYVVDMIDCRFINFAVFNVADSFVCIGAGLMILYLIVLTVKEIKAEKAAKLALAEGEEIPESADATTDGAFAAEETTREDEGDTDTIEERVEDTTEGGDHE